MDELAKRFFHDPDAYAQAIKLLARYEEVENINWQSVEDYLSGLEEGESGLLELAIKHRCEVQKSQQQTLRQIATLEKSVEALSATAIANSKSKAPVSDLADFVALAISSPLPSEKVTTSSNADPLLTEVRQKFLDYKRDFVTAGTLVATESKIDLFVKILTEQNRNQVPRISELSSEKMRDCRDVLVKIPANRGTLPKDLSIKEMLRMKLRPIKYSTVKDTSVLIGQFLTWIEREGYPITTGLRSILSSIRAPRQKDDDKRLNFNAEDLQRLFSWESYVKGTFERASEYWVPLIALYTGARMAEIVQLHCSDIHEQEGEWVFKQ